MTSTKRENLPDRLKKICYRAHHRGTQEMDIILGGYVDDVVSSLNDGELDDLETLMSETDADLYNWIIGKTPLDDAPFPDLLRAITKHQQERVDNT
ncbi:succinate dehydrogenase assembly factor 2 [Maritalea sp.]|uniref:FAD assembly factor SdhE n=1 Tax=Maritalea sp. TaxID=2003361 RepID=UPI003EFA1E19